ncbi:hypothetical protein [Leifsonia sp. 21MFCrub1.1]|uniref:hypothetical protein n=1 Tax=Leifsonia sp. 21MFCrub1.1 TaxID=1798223 RepID=UPI0008928CF8|nr:hypothetical protein [Leifsonia sp. 21MFCrub1.1]SEA59857.1 hypothetical protein SAMN04515680_0868 [Leifsonia sp. 21MFCrub1.1]
MPRRISDAGIDRTCVPAELLDVDDATWSAGHHSTNWLKAHGFGDTVPSHYQANWDEVSPSNRYWEAVQAWARVNGLVMPRSKGFVDLNALRALGIERPPHLSRDRVQHLTEMGLWGRHSE